MKKEKKDKEKPKEFFIRKKEQKRLMSIGRKGNSGTRTK